MRGVHSSYQLQDSKAPVAPSKHSCGVGWHPEHQEGETAHKNQ